jgi:hypothetical protein
VQELLGHRELRTTMIYTHVLDRGPFGAASPFDRLLGLGPPPRPASLATPSLPASYAAPARSPTPLPGLPATANSRDLARSSPRPGSPRSRT